MNVAVTPLPKLVERASYLKQSPELFAKLTELLKAIERSTIEEPIRDLVGIRTAQMNGCTFCLDIHVKQAKMRGERELRIYHLAAWRDSALFSPRERAALTWTEALTNLPEQGVPDELYELVRTQLSEKEISDLTFVIAIANSLNRLNVGFKSAPGSFDDMLGLRKAGLN